MIAKIEFRGGTSVELIGIVGDVSTVLSTFGVGTDTAQTEPVPALTQEEREHLTKAYDDGYRWIGRDKDATLCVFKDKPDWDGTSWGAHSTEYDELPDELCSFVKAPEDCQAMEIGALLSDAFAKGQEGKCN